MLLRKTMSRVHGVFPPATWPQSGHCGQPALVHFPNGASFSLYRHVCEPQNGPQWMSEMPGPPSPSKMLSATVTLDRTTGPSKNCGSQVMGGGIPVVRGQGERGQGWR